LTDAALAGLAEAAGIQTRWVDVHGTWHDVSPDTMRHVLRGLGLPADTPDEMGESEAVLRRRASALPSLVTADQGEAVRLPTPPGRYRLVLESGEAREGEASADGGGAVIAGVDQPGYHRLEIGAATATLAVAPPRCFTVLDAAPGARPWALAAQLYALRRDGDGGLGDFAALEDFVRAAGRHGAAAVAISPVHAQFSADPDRFSPYSPSSRLMLNVLHAPVRQEGEADAAREREPLVDWPVASRSRLAVLRQVFESADGATLDALAAFRAEQGDALETHARFEAIHAAQFGADPTRWHWRTWPDDLRDPRSPAVARFAEAHARDVAFHAYMQMLAAQSLGRAQAAAREAGMAIGLIADLAVGADGGGSHAWARQPEILGDLSIGAPPDLYALHGQDWGLSAFSPLGLAEHGFGAYIEMLRAAMQYAGGIRIDHAMGLRRLWVIPHGAQASEGAYLAFPLRDLLRLTRLESDRHRAVVIAEDLGTVPEGFSAELYSAGILGMRVLWFERDAYRFFPPRTWPTGAVAMTTTHDLASVAGWWSGHDLDWRERTGQLGDAARERADRDADRGRLWAALQASGAAVGDPPPQDAAASVADAALRHVGRATCDLALIPVEDALALPDQPNLPGPDAGHPNWRRRLPGPAKSMLDAPDVAARLAGLRDARIAAA
jgi:4-alpha-glucanotransferase